MKSHQHLNRFAPWLALLAITSLAGCASQGPPEYGSPAGPEKSTSGSAKGVREIVIEIPVGSVSVTATSGSSVSASLEVRCDERKKSCLRLAESVFLRQQIFEDRMFLRPSNQSKFAFRNSQSDYAIEVPENTPVRIIMGYGSLNVKGLRSDLTIDMSAGEVSVQAPLSEIRRVWADANFGDASLSGGGPGSQGERRLLVGAEADWRDGPGQHDIVIDLNAGDISVSLTSD